MTTHADERDGESPDRPSGVWPGVGRRPLLKALGAGAALSGGSGVVTATDDGDEDEENQQEGFKTEVLAPHSTFADEVGAVFGVAYEDGPEEVAFLRDASSVMVVRGTIEPGGSSGWHIDRGPAIAVVVEGEIDVTFEDECVTHTLAAGEALLATGQRADLVENASDTEEAMAYIIFLGVPDGEPPSEAVEPPDC